MCITSVRCGVRYAWLMARPLLAERGPRYFERNSGGGRDQMVDPLWFSFWGSVAGEAAQGEGGNPYVRRIQANAVTSSSLTSVALTQALARA